MYLLQPDYTLEIRIRFRDLQGITRKIFCGVTRIIIRVITYSEPIRTLANAGIAIHG